MAFLEGTNSFVSLADANAYFADRPNSTWTAATDEEKEFALISGTDYLIQQYTGRWVGYITSTSQDLPWPRSGVYTSDGVMISSSVVPDAIKNATSEMALRSLSNANLVVDTSPGKENLKSNKTDVLKKEWFQGASTQTTYSAVEMMLYDYVLQVNGGVEIVRC